jgi:hypothetical protein
MALGPLLLKRLIYHRDLRTTYQDDKPITTGSSTWRQTWAIDGKNQPRLHQIGRSSLQKWTTIANT